MVEVEVLDHIFDRYEDAVDRLTTARTALAEERNERIQAESARDAARTDLLASNIALTTSDKAMREWRDRALKLAAENANLKKLIPVENLPIETAEQMVARIDAPARLAVGGELPRDPTTNLPF